MQYLLILMTLQSGKNYFKHKTYGQYMAVKESGLISSWPCGYLESRKKHKLTICNMEGEESTTMRHGQYCKLHADENTTTTEKYEFAYADKKGKFGSFIS